MKNNQIKIGAILSYLSIVINILAGLIYTPWMINQIGKSQYGIFTLVNSLISLFLIDFGLSSAVSRYVSKYKAEGNEQKVNDFLGIVYKLYVIIDIIIFLVLFITYFFIDDIYLKLTPLELKKFKVVYIIAASFSVINFPFITFNGILNSYEKFIQIKIGDIIYRVTTIILMVLSLIMGYGLYALVSVNALAGIIVTLYKYIIIKKKTNIKVNYKYSNKEMYKSIFSFSFWTTISSIFQRLIFNITPTILGIVSNTSSIAIFGLIVSLEGYVYNITSAINGMFMPKISQIYAKNKKNPDIMPLMLKVGKFQFILNSLIVVGFVVVGKQFIYLWMGLDYMAAYYGICLVIIPGIFFNSLQIANTAIVVKNKVKLQALIQIITGIVNVCFSFVLSRFYGVIGASIAIFIAYSIRAIFMHIVSQRVLNVSIWYFIKNCYLKVGRAAIITLIGGIIINCMRFNYSWINLILQGTLIVILYSISLMLFGFTKYERNQIIDKIKYYYKKIVKKENEQRL